MGSKEKRFSSSVIDIRNNFFIFFFLFIYFFLINCSLSLLLMHSIIIVQPFLRMDSVEIELFLIVEEY